MAKPHRNDRSVLVADVGGTYGRFALAAAHAGETVLTEIRTLPTAEAGSFGDLLAAYLDTLQVPLPTEACLATAGPNNGRRGELLNCGWALDAAELEQRFAFSQLNFINDFEALALRVPLLDETGSIGLSAAISSASGPITVIGPGTGLGVALLVPVADGFQSVATEGGHTSFAPNSDLEAALRDSLAAEFTHVHAELVLSGPGMTRIHDFLARHAGQPAPALAPADISRAALQGDADCERTVELFLAILGSVAGDFALAHGARGGVFLGGGILPQILPLVQRSNIVERFQAKDQLQDYMRAIPLRLITEEHSALYGAAQWHWQGPH